MTSERVFQPYGWPHLTVIFLTLSLPFVLAAVVHRTKSTRLERAIVVLLSAVLVANYIAYLIFVRSHGIVTWQQMLPLQLCDWGMVVVIVALWTGSQRWFEVAYFWGIGGTLQAVLTPNLRFGFPDLRFISFFTSHSGIIIGVVFLMLTHKYRPYPMSILRTFLWSEFYFVVTGGIFHFELSLRFAPALPLGIARGRLAFLCRALRAVCHCRSCKKENN